MKRISTRCSAPSPKSTRIFAATPAKRLEPTREHLDSPGLQLLSTTHGPLDLLGAIEHGLTYEQLLPDSIEMAFDGDSIQVLSLGKYVELKEQSTQAKDRARLPILRETREMTRSEKDRDEPGGDS